MNVKFDSEPVYSDNDKYIKKFSRQKKKAKENALHKCLSLVTLDSVIRANKKYYPQKLLEECKYEIKRTK